jgi:hypothetical protein
MREKLGATKWERRYGVWGHWVNGQWVSGSVGQWSFGQWVIRHWVIWTFQSGSLGHWGAVIDSVVIESVGHW